MKKGILFISLCLVLIVVRGLIAYTYRVQFPPFRARELLVIKGVTFQTGNATLSVVNDGYFRISIEGVYVDDEIKTVLATGGSLEGSGPYDLGGI